MSNWKKIFGIISLLCGFISILFVAFNAMQTPNPMLMVLALILAFLGIISGVLGIVMGDKDTRLLAIAGLILGILGLIFPIWTLIYVLRGWF